MGLPQISRKLKPLATVYRCCRIAGTRIDSFRLYAANQEDGRLSTHSSSRLAIVGLVSTLALEIDTY